MKINTPQQMGYIWHWWFSYSPENVVLVRCGSTVATYLTAGPYKVVLWVCFGKQTHSDSNWSVQAKCGTKKTTDVGHIWTKQNLHRLRPNMDLMSGLKVVLNGLKSGVREIYRTSWSEPIRRDKDVRQRHMQWGGGGGLTAQTVRCERGGAGGGGECLRREDKRKKDCWHHSL